MKIPKQTTTVAKGAFDEEVRAKYSNEPGCEEKSEEAANPRSGELSSTSISIVRAEKGNAGVQALQRDRLMHLRHTIKCPYGKGVCPITPHCWRIKVLWKHMLDCKDNDCSYSLCASSRYVLSHYHSCAEANCEVCVPVKETYKRAHTEEEEREILRRCPPKRMRVSRSQPNFVLTRQATNSFDEGRELRTRIIRDGDNDVEERREESKDRCEVSDSMRPFLSQFVYCQLSGATITACSSSDSSDQGGFREVSVSQAIDAENMALT